MNTLNFLIVLLLIIWIWQDSLRVREFAVKYCHNKCDEMGFQLLDQTIALSSVSIKRKANGMPGLFRHYNFEFSINGANRFKGTIMLQQNHVRSFQLEHPDGLLIFDENNPS